MKIGGLQKLTLLDYPGKTACTVFLQGCNFRCPYCHNAGLVLPGEEDLIEEETLFAFLKKRQGILDGVCITGGEPLLQKDTIELMKRIKNLGYLIKLDTNGSFPKRLKEVCELGLVDYVAMDIKHAPQKYADAIGCSSVGIEKMEESVRYLIDGKVDYEFRTTLVKGIHTLEDMRQMVQFIQGAKKYYLQNFRDSGHLVGTNNQNIIMDSFTETELADFLAVAKEKMDVILRNI